MERDLPPTRALRFPVVDAIECMVPTLSHTTDDVLLCSTVFGSYAGPGDFHVLPAKDRRPPADEALFYLARRTGASTVLFGSKASGPIASVHSKDVELCGHLLDAAKRNGIYILEHVVVLEDMFRLMSESTSLWPWPHELMN